MISKILVCFTFSFYVFFLYSVYTLQYFSDNKKWIWWQSVSSSSKIQWLSLAQTKTGGGIPNTSCTSEWKSLDKMHEALLSCKDLKKLMFGMCFFSLYQKNTVYADWIDSVQNSLKSDSRHCRNFSPDCPITLFFLSIKIFKYFWQQRHGLV